MTALTVTDADERQLLREIVLAVTYDYPFEPELQDIETAIGRLAVCARMIRMAAAGAGHVDAALLAELRREEKDLVEAIGDETYALERLSAPDVDPTDYSGQLADVKEEHNESRERFVGELAACRRLIARAEAVA